MLSILILVLTPNICEAYFEYNTIGPPLSSVAVIQRGGVSKMCRLKPDAGPCRAGLPMYYYDPETRSCNNTFNWGGCQGNGNRFDTQKECEKTCKEFSPYDITKPPRYCNMFFDYGWCFGAEPRYYWDKLYKVCKKGLYSGCGGNKNNFYSKVTCERVCQFGQLVLPGINYVDPIHHVDDGIDRVLIINPKPITNSRSPHITTTTKCRDGPAPTTKTNKPTTTEPTQTTVYGEKTSTTLRDGFRH